MTPAEVRHPDFYGLQQEVDEVGAAAVVAQNADLWKVGELDSRGGLIRLNHIRYPGPIVALLDVQRICDYGKFLVASSNIFEHEEIVDDYGGEGGGGGGGTPFFNKGFPPVAVANAAPLAGIPALTVQLSSAGSFDPDGGPLIYSWNFGDGPPASNLANPIHIYAADGLFTAQLTVTDVQGRTAVDTVQIDTRLTVVVATGNVYHSQTNGAVPWVQAVGIPAGNTFWVLTVDGKVYAFRNNGGANTVDVYESVDRGVNFVLVGSAPSTGGASRQPARGANNRIVIPVVNAGNCSTAYSDDLGRTWNISVVEPALANLCLITYMGGNRLAAMHQTGVGLPYQTHISNNNGAAWAAGVGVWGDSGSIPEVAAFNGNRLVCTGSDGGIWEIRTSDDLGLTWQLRQVLAGGPLAVRASGQEALTDPVGLGNNPFWSGNRGTGWVNFPAFGADARAYWKRSDGWFAGAGTGIWFADALPNFLLQGNLGAGLVLSLTGLPE